MSITKADAREQCAHGVAVLLYVDYVNLGNNPGRLAAVINEPEANKGSIPTCRKQPGGSRRSVIRDQPIEAVEEEAEEGQP